MIRLGHLVFVPAWTLLNRMKLGRCIITGFVIGNVLHSIFIIVDLGPLRLCYWTPPGRIVVLPV